MHTLMHSLCTQMHAHTCTHPCARPLVCVERWGSAGLPSALRPESCLGSLGYTWLFSTTPFRRDFCRLALLVNVQGTLLLREVCEAASLQVDMSICGYPWVKAACRVQLSVRSLGPACPVLLCLQLALRRTEAVLAASRLAGRLMMEGLYSGVKSLK